VIGHISATSHDTATEQPDLDWALVEIDDVSLRRPNLLLSLNKANFMIDGHELAQQFIDIQILSHDRRVAMILVLMGLRPECCQSIHVFS
jgi:hypothetical protein